MCRFNLTISRQAATLLLLLLCSLIIPVMPPAQANGDQLSNNLQLVGEARLSKLFWTIYDSRLYTRDGNYQGIAPGMVLEISYQRKITSQQLVESTREEWQMLELYKPHPSDMWLKRLRDIWPDVKKGDVITLRVGNDLKSHFYFNGQAIGNIEASEFTKHFLAIWLSPNARYPKLQQQLIGAEKAN